MNHPATRSSRPSPFPRRIVFAASVLVAGSAAGQVSSWTNPSGGFYDDASSWSMGVPDTISASAEISLAGMYTVTVRTSPTAGSLAIRNPGAVLAINSDRSYGVANGSVVNDGLIVLNADQGPLSSLLDIGGGGIDGMLTGTGVLELNLGDASDDLAGARVRISGNGLHGAGHTIKGKGTVLGVFTNSGLILADRPGQELRIGGNVRGFGSGAFRATNGGVLGVADGAVIRGGSVSSDSGGRIRFGSGTGTLTNGVVLSGVVETTDAGQMIIAGPVTNNATVSVNAFQSSSISAIRIRTSAAISGSGKIDLNVADSSDEFSEAYIYTDSGVIATNGASHTISGKGRIDGSWINEGTFLSDRPGQELRVRGEVVQSGEGELRAVNGGVLGLNNLTLTGGSLTTDEGGHIVATGGPTTLVGVTNEGTLGLMDGQTLVIASGLTNNGIVDVGDDGSVFGTTLTLVDNANIDGAGAIRLYERSQLRVANGTTGTLGASQLIILGEGFVIGNWIVHGEIRADRPGGGRIFSNSMSGSDGLLNAINGGVIIFEAHLDGLTLASDDAGGGVYAAGRQELPSRANNIHNTGVSGIVAGRRLDLLAGGMINDGMFVVNVTAEASPTTLYFLESAAINGTGRVELNLADAGSDYEDAEITTDFLNAAIATNGPGHTIAGKGQISGTWINEGIIVADRPGQDLRISDTMTQTSTGVIRGENGGRATLSNASLSGGTLASSTGGGVDFRGRANTIANIRNTGEAGVREFASVDILGGLINDGIIVVNSTAGISIASLDATVDSTIEGNGGIVLNTSKRSGLVEDARLRTDPGVTLTLGPGQTISGRGQLLGSFRVEGALSPGSADAPTDIITADSNGPDSGVVLTETSVYEVQASFIFIHDRIEATVPVELGGTLRFEPIDGFVPFVGAEFPLITAPSITGGFDAVEFTGDLAPGGVFRVFVEPTRVLAVVTCSADLALPVGSLTFADISVFLSAFAARDPAADFAAPAGEFTFADISAFLSAFAGGCP